MLGSVLIHLKQTNTKKLHKPKEKEMFFSLFDSTRKKNDHLVLQLILTEPYWNINIYFNSFFSTKSNDYAC
jgi:hypothetical protein